MSGKTYTILVVNDIDGPEFPERFALEVSDGVSPVILTYSQDIIGTTEAQLFIDLKTLERLGVLAASIRDEGTPERFADKVETWE